MTPTPQPKAAGQERSGNTGMFWYAIQLIAGSNECDDWRFTEDRGGARIAMLIGLKVRVVAKPLAD